MKLLRKLLKASKRETGAGKTAVEKVQRNRPAPSIRLRPAKRRTVKDKWGNIRTIVEVKTPRKIARRITVIREVIDAERERRELKHGQ